MSKAKALSPFCSLSARAVPLAAVTAALAASASAQTVLRVNQFATGANDGSSFADGFTTLDAALSNVTNPNSTEIWIA